MVKDGALIWGNHLTLIIVFLLQETNCGAGVGRGKTFRNSELSLDAFHTAMTGRNVSFQLKPKLETDPESADGAVAGHGEGGRVLGGFADGTQDGAQK